MEAMEEANAAGATAFARLTELCGDLKANLDEQAGAATTTMASAPTPPMQLARPPADPLGPDVAVPSGPEEPLPVPTGPPKLLNPDKQLETEIRDKGQVLEKVDKKQVLQEGISEPWDPEHWKQQQLEWSDEKQWDTAGAVDPWSAEQWEEWSMGWSQGGSTEQAKLNSDDEEELHFLHRQAQEYHAFKMRKQMKQQQLLPACSPGASSSSALPPPAQGPARMLPPPASDAASQEAKPKRQRGERRGTRHEWFAGLHKAKKNGPMAEAAYVRANPMPPKAPKH